MLEYSSSILGRTLFLLYIKDLPDDVIRNIVIYADDTTPYSKYNQGSDLWQKLYVARMSMSTVSFLVQLDSGTFCLQNAYL